jgi:hypothetical protein
VTELPPFTPPPLPRGWDKVAHPVAGAVWLAIEPTDLDEPDRFRANLVLTCDDLDGRNFRDWQVATDALLPAQLHDYLLIDLERLEIDGRPAGRRLAHHIDPEARALTMEQWFVAGDTLGWTLTATMETWAYDETADELAEIARAWRPLSGTLTGHGA